MKKVFDFLKGKKSYLIAVLGATFGVLLVFKVIILTPEQLTAISFLWLAVFGSALRAGVSK